MRMMLLPLALLSGLCVCGDVEAGPRLAYGYRVEFWVRGVKRFDSRDYPGTWLAEANKYRLALHKQGYTTYIQDDGTASGGPLPDGGLGIGEGHAIVHYWSTPRSREYHRLDEAKGLAAWLRARGFHVKVVKFGKFPVVDPDAIRAPNRSGLAPGRPFDPSRGSKRNPVPLR